MAKSRYADATKAARGAAMSAHKATSASKDAATAAVQPPASDNAAVSARDARRDELTHVDAKGEVRMVDVSDKAETHRIRRFCFLRSIFSNSFASRRVFAVVFSAPDVPHGTFLPSPYFWAAAVGMRTVYSM